MTGRTALPELLHHAQQQALAHTRAASGRADLPAWISAVPGSTTANPLHHEYLTDSAALIANRLSVLADRTVETRPEWSRTLGEAPADPTQHAQWQQLALVAAYRDQYKVTDDNAAQPAGPYIEEGRTGHDAYWQATAAAIAARRTAAAPASAEITPATTDQQALRQLAADVYRALPEADQTEILRAVAARTGATWLASLPRLDDAALTQQTVAEQVTTVLAERRQLTTEAVRPEQPQAEEQRQPTLAERRQAERQAHREQLQQRGGQPATRATRPASNRRVEPADQRQAPAQRPAEQRQPLQPRPQQIQHDPQGPRLR